MGQKPINEGRQMASKIKIGQYTVFPCGVVGFFQVKENGKNMFFFGKKALRMKLSIVPADLQCYVFSENSTAPRSINLWIPRPTSIVCSPSSPSFLTTHHNTIQQVFKPLKSKKRRKKKTKQIKTCQIHLRQHRRLQSTLFTFRTETGTSEGCWT